MRKISIPLLLLALLVSCAPADTPAPSPSQAPSAPPAPTSTPMPEALWIDPAAPPQLVNLAQTWGISLTGDPLLATQKLELSDSGSLWIYALVAPFPTLTDEVASQALIARWRGDSTAPLAGSSLLMAESTRLVFSAQWGEPAAGVVRVLPEREILDSAWKESAWALIPFEDIQPKWKVLAVDGQSPIRKDFDPSKYPLKAYFSSSQPLPESNRDPSKLTTVILTGVTALVRATAATMELKGVTYPAGLIGGWLREADLTHINNEVAFDKTCPPPRAGHRNFILCSDPKYIALLLDVGTDVVELTGDHLLDRGSAALLETLNLYKEHEIPYYGGGMNAEEARRPVLFEVNGNKIAFMGCNGKREEKYPKAGANSPGPALCDYKDFARQIQDLKAKGYQVIFTFQHEECYSPMPCYMHEAAFRAAADLGAAIVSGSQAHYPHIMEFRGDSFIHYGLGNLFFDQMTYILLDGKVIDETRREFYDRHVFYDGRYLGVELLIGMLEDYSRPRPATEAERRALLAEYFYFSGWTNPPPTVIPLPTATLTPIALP